MSPITLEDPDLPNGFTQNQAIYQQVQLLAAIVAELGVILSRIPGGGPPEP